MQNRALFFIFLFIIFTQTSFSQGNGNGKLRESAIKVFLDCHRCDNDFVKREIPYVNYVRERKEADVHILVTTERTGSGGIEYQINYLGQNDYEGIKDQVRYISSADDTSEVTRQGRTNMMALGLMQFVSKTPLANKIKITYNGNGHKEADKEVVIDKWNSWVFDTDFSVDYDQQSTYINPEAEADFSVEKITPDWKVEFATGYDYVLRKYIYEDTVYQSTRNNASFRHLLVKSLNDHWSVGGRIYFNSDTYQNRKLAWSIYPAVEYNVFPYYESSLKQFRFQYRVGYGYNYYSEETIYSKMEEGLFGQQLSVAYALRQPWGYVNSSLSGFSYLHDLSKNNLQFSTWVSIRLFKGLSLSLSGRAKLIHDQLSLPKSGSTAEEVLLRQRQIATSYSYNFKVGFSYTFGSIYNNVVNPRFGDSRY
jgi:hypothetical protein